MKKNILIIDDSALMRRLISDIINSDDRFTVSGFATNGLEGFEYVVNHPGKCDAIILDINMPKMNGLEFLEQLVKNHIKATVIVVSTVAKEGAKETIRALELGAFDFVTKPDSFLEAKGTTFKDHILECLLVATKLYQTKSPVYQANTIKTESRVTTPLKPIVPRLNRVLPNKKDAAKLIALTCSTGGPKALQMVIPYIPADIDASMIVVQHMPEGFTNSLAQRLNEMSKVTVKEAQHGEVLKKGVVYVAKGGSQLRIIRRTSGEYELSVTVEAARGGLKPCADIMYESLLNSRFDEITCVVLTGMGADGTSGIKQLVETKKIYVIAQDEATSTVYGMPKVITETGLVDEVRPLNDIAGAITRNVGVQ